MEWKPFSEPYAPTANSPASHPQQHAIDFDRKPQPLPNQYTHSLTSHHAPAYSPPSMLPTQYMAPGNHGAFHPRGDWHQPPVENGPFVSDGLSPMGIFLIQSQTAHLSHAEIAMATTVQSNPTNEQGDRPQAHRRQAARWPVPQVPYKPTRHRFANIASPGVISFVIDGAEGIRLSDASEGNWTGFEGRDDRSLFQGDRSHIMIRIHLVGCSPWKSKIPTADFTVKRRPITRTKLAAQVAKSVKKFIAREKLNGHDVDHPHCGWGDMSLENVFLTRIVRVSPASWQPEFFVERPPGTLQVACPTSSSVNPPT